MSINSDEKAWLSSFSKALATEFPGRVLRIAVFGSKARGDDDRDSDLDVLLIVKNNAARFKRRMRRVGYELAATGDAVPSIMAYTESEWQSGNRSDSSFKRNVERDQVFVP